MFPEASTVDSKLIALKYFGAAIDLFVFLFVVKAAYLATIKPRQIGRTLLAASFSALVASQIFALGIHVAPFVLPLCSLVGIYAGIGSFLSCFLVFFGADILVLTIMKWRTKRTIIGLLLLDALFAISGLASACLFSPVISGGLLRLAIWGQF